LRQLARLPTLSNSLYALMAAVPDIITQSIIKEVQSHMANRRRAKLVPECDTAIQQWKYEIASQLGIGVAQSSSMAGLNYEMGGELGGAGGSSGRQEYWGYLTAREAGAVGGSITKRLIAQAEQSVQQTLQ
jgi:hypothetical protein